MNRNGEKLGRRINKLLELSRLDADKVVVNYSAVPAKCGRQAP
ncbi:MAG: hypothetical protein AAF960_06480 [Bacteroidota bacterium]